MMRNQTLMALFKASSSTMCKAALTLKLTWMETNFWANCKCRRNPLICFFSISRCHPTVFSWRSLWFRWRSILWWYLSRSGMSTLCRDMACHWSLLRLASRTANHSSTAAQAVSQSLLPAWESIQRYRSQHPHRRVSRLRTKEHKSYRSREPWRLLHKEEGRCVYRPSPPELRKLKHSSKTQPCFRLYFVCFVHLMYSLSWSVDTHSYLCYHSQQIHRDFCKETILCGFISCEDLPPRNTPDHFAVCFTRQNPSPVLRGRYFSFPGKIAPWKFHEPTERDTGSLVNAAAKQGQELRSGQTAIHIYEQWNSLLIFAS